MYQFDLAQRWQREHAGFVFVPVLSQPDAESWTGRTGHVDTAILQDFPDLSGHEIYICGSAQLVENAVPEFLAQGAAETACFTDAFTASGTVPAGKVASP